MTRRTVSIKGETYDRLRLWACAHSRSMSDVIEELIDTLPHICSRTVPRGTLHEVLRAAAEKRSAEKHAASCAFIATRARERGQRRREESERHGRIPAGGVGKATHLCNVPGTVRR